MTCFSLLTHQQVIITQHLSTNGSYILDTFSAAVKHDAVYKHKWRLHSIKKINNFRFLFE